MPSGSLSWRDKVVLITGASSGFGNVLARTLVRRGAKTILVARDASRLADAVRAIESREQVGSGADNRVCGRAADVTRADDVAALMTFVLERHGRLDMLVNGVGRSDRGLVGETPPERFRELWETNFLSAVRCTQAALPYLVQARGHVVFLGSLASKVGSRYLGAYPASKFPLAAFAQQLRMEVPPDDLHVLLVCPGPLAREDAGRRYQDLTDGLPSAAQQPGAGVRLKGIDPESLAEAVLRACDRRVPELIVPAKARWLFAISQLFPSLGDWILRRKT